MTTLTVDRRDAMDTLGVAIMLGLTLSWGLNGVAVKISSVGYSPVAMLLARSGVAAVLIFFWCRFRGIALFQRDGTLVSGLIAGALFFSEFIVILFAFEYTTAARGTLLINTMPFWMLIGAHFLLGERMSVRKFAGLVLAFVGVAVVFSDKLSAPGPDALKGDLMFVLAGALWAATTLVIKGSKLANASAEKMLLYQLSVSAVLGAMLVPFAPPLLREVSALATASLVFQTVFIVAFTYCLWFWVVRRYPAAGLSSFTFLTPAFGVLGAAVVLNEPLGPRIIVALVLIAIGLIVVNRPSKPKNPIARA